MIPVFFIAVVLGLCVGSFLNVIIHRLPKGMSVIGGRSFCPRCRKKISWFDNIPLLSFVLLAGKCRHCKKPISWRYPLVELITGILFVLEVFRLGNLGDLGVLGVERLGIDLILVSSLIVIFFIDLEHQIIPDEIIIFDVAITLILLISQYPNILISNIFVALACSGFFLALHLITKGRGMGLGDVKFAFLIGLVLGFPRVVVCFYLAFLTGAIIGIILIIARLAKFGQQIAFGPFLSLAFLVTFFAGEKILWLAKQIFF